MSFSIFLRLKPFVWHLQCANSISCKHVFPPTVCLTQAGMGWSTFCPKGSSVPASFVITYCSIFCMEQSPFRSSCLQCFGLVFFIVPNVLSLTHGCAIFASELYKSGTKVALLSHLLGQVPKKFQQILAKNALCIQ